MLDWWSVINHSSCKEKLSRLYWKSGCWSCCWSPIFALQQPGIRYDTPNLHLIHQDTLAGKYCHWPAIRKALMPLLSGVVLIFIASDIIIIILSIVLIIFQGTMICGWDKRVCALSLCNISVCILVTYNWNFLSRALYNAICPPMGDA